MEGLLRQAAGLIRQTGTFVLPELTLSFYSDKEPVLLSVARRIEVTDCQLADDVLLLTAGNKPLVVSVNPDETLIEKLENGEVSALMVAIEPSLDLQEQLIEGALNKAWLYNVYAHKIFSSFLQASDKLPVMCYGQLKHVQGCPIEERVYQGKAYANLEQDCLSCMFCIDTSEKGYVQCTGRNRLAVPEDFKRSLSERRAVYDELLQPDKIETVTNGLCPHCGGRLVEKTGEKGKFLGCSHYPFCHFTAERKDDGTVSFYY